MLGSTPVTLPLMTMLVPLTLPVSLVWMSAPLRCPVCAVNTLLNCLLSGVRLFACFSAAAMKDWRPCQGRMKRPCGVQHQPSMMSTAIPWRAVFGAGWLECVCMSFPWNFSFNSALIPWTVYMILCHPCPLSLLNLHRLVVHAYRGTLSAEDILLRKFLVSLDSWGLSVPCHSGYAFSDSARGVAFHPKSLPSFLGRDWCKFALLDFTTYTHTHTHSLSLSLCPCLYQSMYSSFPRLTEALLSEDFGPVPVAEVKRACLLAYLEKSFSWGQGFLRGVVAHFLSAV